jgi:hypothetical protein
MAKPFFVLPRGLEKLSDYLFLSHMGFVNEFFFPKVPEYFLGDTTFMISCTYTVMHMFRQVLFGAGN